MATFDSYQYCQCGAVTVFTEDGQSYSCFKKNINKHFLFLDFSELKRLPNAYMCDHCVNRYGLDLCGCGSGEDFGKCDNGFAECKMPMQRIGEYSYVRASDSLL